MQEASMAVADPGRRPAHQFAGVDLRRPKGYAQAAAPEPPAREAAPAAKAAAEGGDPCPRCASRDTKFCYYNNYNTAQPRHFCKGCRRYWTKGGTLRNVPVGGGTRKKPSASSSPSSYTAAGAAGVDSKPATKKKPACKKRRVEAPAPVADASAATDPVVAAAAASAATDSGKTTTTTTTTADGASEITTESAAAAVPVAAPAAAEEEDSDSLTHLLLQPGAEDAVALGLGLSDFPSAGKALPLLDDDSFQWPAAYDLGACWATSAGFGDTDPAGLFLNLP